MAKLLTIPLAIVALIGAVGFYRLPSGWVGPSFHAALAEAIGPVQVAIPEVQVRWGGWRHPLGMNIRHVTLKKEGSGLTLTTPSLLLSLKMMPLLMGKAEIGRYSFEAAKVYFHHLLLGEISGTVKRRGKNLSLRADFQKLDLTALTHMFMGKSCPPSAVFPFQGTLTLEGSPVAGLTKIGLFCKSEGGTLVIPKIYPNPLSLGQIEFFLTGDGQTLTLTKASLKREDAMLTVQGTLHSPVSWKDLYEGGGKAGLSLEGKGAAIPVDDLALLWPHGLSPKPRQWVVQQLSKGTVGSVTTRLHGVIDVKPRAKTVRFEAPDIQGQIEAKGVTVAYFGKLPPVVNVVGKCHFTRQQFMVDAVGMANGIQLKTAKIVIHDTHLKDQTIDIVLNLEGPVRNSLKLIDSEPLFLARKLDLNPDRISGQAITDLHLSFPLETDTPLDLVTVSAKSQIKDGGVIYDTKLDGRPVTLDQGTFALEVSKKSLEMKGQGHIQGVEAHIQWQEYFEGKGIPFRRQFLLQGDLDLRKLKNFGIDATGYLDGKAKTRVQYTNNDATGGVVEGFADLTPAIMVSPLLSWQKEKGKPGHLKVKGKLKGRTNLDQQEFTLDAATLIAPGLAVVIGEREGKRGKYFEVSHLKIDNSYLKSRIYQRKEGGIQATVWGKMLDLSKILDDSAPEPLLKSGFQQGHKDEPQIKVNVSLDKVHLGKNNEIHQVKGDMFYRRNTLKWANLKGKIPHTDEVVSLNMTPLSQSRQQFIIKSGNGGSLLGLLGAGYDVEGGQLVIEGVKSEKWRPKDAEKSWEVVGAITINDFTINRAPLLARLLSAASLNGIVNFFSGKGIHFRNGSADFSLTPETLNLKNGRLTSFSLGLLLSGSVDRLRHQVNFTGELIPLYIVNTLLAQVPLVGHWISGGREDGIFLTRFTLKGDRKDPTLAINPMSSVTPGLVREFLTAQEEKP